MQARKKKSAATVSQTFLASLPPALNVSCTERIQRNAIYHFFAPHFAKNYSWELIIMWRRHFPVHSPRTIFVFWLSFLYSKEATSDIWLTLVPLSSFHNNNFQLISEELHAGGKSVYVTVCLICTCCFAFCPSTGRPPTAENHVTPPNLKHSVLFLTSLICSLGMHKQNAACCEFLRWG